MTLEGILGPKGALAQALPGYEHRHDQLAMAREVERALEARRYLVVEAGTGTGKTLAYLVPAALSGRKVIVSTATKTLQEQIWQKDLPLLAEKGGLEVEAAYLKGRANYYCLARGEKFAQNPAFPSRDEAALWPRIADWARSTDDRDRSELDLPDQYGAWRELSASGETCLGKECQRYEECFVTLARARAAQADVVLVNHHLFFADLAMRTSRAGRRGPARVRRRHLRRGARARRGGERVLRAHGVVVPGGGARPRRAAGGGGPARPHAARQGPDRRAHQGRRALLRGRGGEHGRQPLSPARSPRARGEGVETRLARGSQARPARRSSSRRRRPTRAGSTRRWRTCARSSPTPT